MATHRPHPTPDRLLDLDGPEPILYDGCERCVEHSHDLLSFDANFTDALWRKMVAVERHDEGRYRSEAERRACVQLYHLAIWLERYAVGDGVNVWKDGLVREGLTP